MASTKRRERKVAPKLALVEEKQEVAVETKDTLDSMHLLQLETMSRDIENAKLLMALEEQALRNMQLENALMIVKIERQKAALAAKAGQYEASKQKFETIKKEIWPRYGFSETDGLGYDTLTGKIVR